MLINPKTIRHILGLFVPPIISKIIALANKHIHTNILYSTISNYVSSTERIFVLGNGPSLVTSIEKYKETLCKTDCIAVNHFAETKYYQVIQPKLYLLADPVYFENPDKLSLRLSEKLITLETAIIDATNWTMSLVVPSSSKNSFFVKKIEDSNKNIKIYYYNNSTISFDWKTQRDKFRLYDKNMVPPPSQTVLNTCIYFAIFAGYQKVIILGADTSWHENLYLDQKTNILYTRDEHFYGTQVLPVYRNQEETIGSKVHEELFNIANALSSYWELRSYANYRKVQIYNASEKSWIDAFDRSKEI